MDSQMPARKPTSSGTIRSWASVVELRHGRVGQSLAPLIENRRRERRVFHRAHDPCGLGAEVLLKSALESRKQFGDRSGGAGGVRDNARKHELACTAGPGLSRRAGAWDAPAFQVLRKEGSSPMAVTAERRPSSPAKARRDGHQPRGRAWLALRKSWSARRRLVRPAGPGLRFLDRSGCQSDAVDPLADGTASLGTGW